MPVDTLRQEERWQRQQEAQKEEAIYWGAPWAMPSKPEPQSRVKEPTAPLSGVDSLTREVQELRERQARKEQASAAQLLPADPSLAAWLRQQRSRATTVTVGPGKALVTAETKQLATPSVQSIQPTTSVTVGPGKALVTAETKQLPQDIQSMYAGEVAAAKRKAQAELERELEQKAAEARAEVEKQIAGDKQAAELVEQQISQWKQEQLQAAEPILEAQARQKVKGEFFTAVGAAAGIGAVVAAPVLAVSSAVGGVVFETTKTGIMEMRLPTVEEVVTAAGVSAAGGAILSGVSSAVGPAVSGAVSKVAGAVSKVAPTVAGKLGAAGEVLAASGLKGFAAREIVGSVGGAVFGGAEAAIEGKDVLKGVAAGAVAGAAGMAAAQITYAGLTRLEREILGVKAYRVKGGESYEITRETEEAVGGTRITKVETEPTRITKQQAELLRYMQTKEVHMAGTRDIIMKGGEDVIKLTGKPAETTFRETASDIIEAASRGGGVITETKFLVKAPEFVGERLMMPEYAAATAKYTGVHVFGKIDPQVYLSYLKNVPPQISQSWLKQMGGLPVEQLTQVTQPINVVAHEVFALPVQRIPLTPVLGAITPPSNVLKTTREESSIVVPKSQPQFKKAAPEPSVAPLGQPKTTPKPSPIDLPSEILRPEPKHKPEVKTAPDILPQVVPAVTPEQKPKPAAIPKVTPTVTPGVTPKPVVVQGVASTVTPKVTPSAILETLPILETSPTPTPAPTPAPAKPEVLLPPWMREGPGLRFGGVAGAILGGKYVKKHQIALPGEVANFIVGKGIRKTAIKVEAGGVYGKLKVQTQKTFMGGYLAAALLSGSGGRQTPRKIVGTIEVSQTRMPTKQHEKTARVKSLAQVILR